MSRFQNFGMWNNRIEIEVFEAIEHILKSPKHVDVLNTVIEFNRKPE